MNKPPERITEYTNIIFFIVRVLHFCVTIAFEAAGTRLAPLISTNPISIAFGPESTGEIIFARLGSIPPALNTLLPTIALSTGDGDVFFGRCPEKIFLQV